MVSPILLTLWACGGGEPPPTPEVTEESWPEMAPVELLTRASLDLRGTRPTDDEIAEVEADPDALDGLLDEFLHDDRFADRVVDLYSEIYLTRSESFYINTAGLDISNTPAFLLAVGEEPLRLLAEVAAEDLPYTEVVTADWTMANEDLAAVNPVDYPRGGSGWQKVQYTDGRPAAGVLATNGLWWRFVSTDSNANRKRANTVSRLFLCEDYLTRPIEFDRNVNLLEEDAVKEALKTNPGCQNCHVSLDPMASFFFGFYWYNYTSPAEATYYHPEREQLWSSYTEVAPSYYGEPGYTLEDLGDFIAGDARFPTCAVEQAFKVLMRRDPTLDDQGRLNAHREDFLAGGLTVRSLFRSMLNDPAYRAADTDDEGAVTRKLVTVDILARQVEDLTGFHWTYSDYDMMRTDSVGLRTLAGGVDGYTVTKSATSPTATLALVVEALAEASSDYAVQQELTQDPGDRRLFTEIDFTETPDSNEAAMVAQIKKLHLRLFGDRVAADGEEVAANLDLWRDLYSVEKDPVAAWTGVLSALMRDPEFLLY